MNNRERMHALGLATSMCLLLILAGCGGGGGGSSSTTTASSGGTSSSSAASSALPAGVFANAFGLAKSYSTLGPIDTTSANPFFKNFGNGRNCGSCHVQGNGFTLSPDEIQARFDSTNGTDPLFLPNDGSNAPNLPVGTLAEKRTAYSLLLNRGLIRVGRPVPTVTNDATPKPAEFVLDSVSDPYNYASATELSLFRRPLPATNLRFIASVMWDDRETIKDFGSPPDATSVCIVDRTVSPPKTGNCYKSFNLALKNQANNATLGHAQAAASLSSTEQQAIVDFELSLFSAQIYDNNAKSLTDALAKGGTDELTTTTYYFDINSVFGDPVTGLLASVTKLTAMSLYTAWGTDTGSTDLAVQAARASIARGEKIFNTRTFKMVNVAGTRTTTITGATCTNCHSTPQVGSLAQPNLFGLGIGDPTWSSLPELPTYTFRNVNSASSNFGKTITVQDPGLALTTGKWGDIGKFKVPPLRALAMRAPYFHDGSAKTIEDVTNFYIKRFVYDTPLTTQDIADLNAFLKAL